MEIERKILLYRAIIYSLKAVQGDKKLRAGYVDEQFAHEEKVLSALDIMKIVAEFEVKLKKLEDEREAQWEAEHRELEEKEFPDHGEESFDHTFHRDGENE